MKRTLKAQIDKNLNKKERNKKIIKLIAKRNDIDSQIDTLRVETELDSLTSTIETAENIVLPFLKDISPENLIADTPLEFILDGNEKAEILEQIAEHYGINIPDDAEINTFGDLVAIMDRMK